MAEQREVIPRERHKWPARAELERMRDTMDSKQISEKLGIPQKTVCNHFARIGIKFRQRPFIMAPSRHKQRRMSIVPDAGSVEKSYSMEGEKILVCRAQTVDEFISSGGTIKVLDGFCDARSARPACTGIQD